MGVLGGVAVEKVTISKRSALKRGVYFPKSEPHFCVIVNESDFDRLVPGTKIKQIYS